MNEITDPRRIDHLVLAVKDLAAARERFHALGFTTTPPSQHPFGTANSLAQFGHSFIELLAVADPAKIPAPTEDFFSFAACNQDFLARQEGLSMVAFSSQDAGADAAAWARRGLPRYQPVDFGRQAKRPDGTVVPVAFTIAFAISQALPDAVFFVCQQHYPENFWQPAYQSHDNGVTETVGVTLVADRPSVHLHFFQAMLGVDAIRKGDSGLEFRLHGGVVEVLTPKAAAERYPGLGEGSGFRAATLACRDLNGLKQALERAGFAVEERGSKLHLGADATFGLHFAFEERS